MPNPERLLTTLRQATVHFRTSPYRRGRVLTLPADVIEVLVAGDLHGSVENFRLILKKADLGNQPQRHLVLQEIVHGSFFYPGGGDKSHQLLDLIAALKCQFPRQVHFLLGNHEVSQWQEQWIGKNDINYNSIFRQGIDEAYGTHADAVYAAYKDLIAAGYVAIRLPNRVFISHTYPSARYLDAFALADLERDDPEPQDLVLGGSIHSIVWGRDTSQKNVDAFLGKVDADLIITGHIPCDRGYEVPNTRQIILDAKGYPACYCLFRTDRPYTQGDLIKCIGTL